MAAETKLNDDIAAFAASLEESYADGIRNGPVPNGEVIRTTAEAIAIGAQRRERAKSSQRATGEDSGTARVRLAR